MSVISAFGIAQTFIDQDLAIYAATRVDTGTLESMTLDWETYFSYFGYVISYLFDAIERIHSRAIMNYESDWYQTIAPEANYKCTASSLPAFEYNMYSEFNTYIYKLLRDPTLGRNQTMWENIGGEYTDYIADIYGSVTVPVYEFAKVDYDSEFEVLFTDLTVDRDSDCDWMMAQIMVMKIAENQCVALMDTYFGYRATAATELSGNQTAFASTKSSLTSIKSGYETLVNTYTADSINNIDVYTQAQLELQR